MSKQRHLSRLAAPRTWPIKRKLSKWITKPISGPHNLNTSLPLVIILRDILKITSSSRETKKLLNSGAVLINSRTIREPRFPVGMFDVISIPAIKAHYRIVINTQGKLVPISTPEADANKLLLRVENKRAVSKSKVQLNFNNGWNMLVDKDTFKVYDAIVFDSEKKKLIAKLELKKGASVYLIGGKHVGTIGKFIGVRETGTLRKHKIAKVAVGKTELESSLKNVFVVGKETPAIRLM